VKKLGVYMATILVAGAVLAVAIIVAVPALGKVATAGEAQGPPIDLTRFADFAVRSQVYATDGTPIATLHGVENRAPVTLDQVPVTVKDAILAVEDAEFYQHRGVNLRALTRAMVENVQAGGVEQGGSTITQQLVKNALLNDERVLNRKVKEAALAIRLEGQMTKDQILESYFNTVYFGSGAYGVQAAAETYWGKNVGELNWAEGAMLAAIISNPIAYDPTLHPDAAKKQRDVALDRMVAYGAITREQSAFAKSWPLPTGRCTGVAGPRPADCGEIVQPPPDSYFVDEVKNELLDLNHHEYDAALGTTYNERYKAVFGGGLRISTTQDPIAQAAADDAQRNTLPKQATDQGITMAMVSVDPATGGVRAVVGGPGFENYKYDLATDDGADGNGGRQTGSSFKTFVLLTALEQGVQPNDFVSGTGSWPNKGGTPDPFTVTGVSGTVDSITSASSNGAFVRLAATVGREHVIDMAERLGVTSKFDPRVIPLPLGVFNVTPLEMASAYSAIPNAGIRQESYFVDKIEDRNGNLLYAHASDPTRGFSQQTACLTTQILQHNVEGGTAKNAQLGAQPAAGKTGTTEKNTDTWFVGFTPYLTTAVWMGYPDEAKPMGTIGGQEQFGGLYPAKAFATYNKAYLDQEKKPVVDFPACAPLSRPGRPAAGAGDPYGTLNGGSGPGTGGSGTGGGTGAGTGTGAAGTGTTDTTAAAGADATTPTTVAPATDTTVTPTTAAP
jgi:membrane peptidoglycan carboxypeptidase